MATQTRISNWIDNVSHSMQTPSPTSRHSYEHHPQQQQYQRHSRPTYSQQYPQQYPQPHAHSNSQTHSRSNSLSRNHSRTRHQIYQEPSRPRSYSQTGSRPQAVHAHSVPPPPPHLHPVHSRTYSYAMNQPPLPTPIPVPQPAPYPNLAPRRSRTLPPQSQNVVYQTYDAPRGSPTYVIVPPNIGGGPHGQQIRMQSPVRVFFLPNKRSGSRG